MRLTKQKKLLQETILRSTSFFDTYELHKKVLQHDSRIGIATVYRFLKYLEDKGEIHSYLCNNHRIYSSTKDNHIHFTCEKCGVIKHLSAKNLDFLQEVVHDQVCHFQIDISGICNLCKRK